MPAIAAFGSSSFLLFSSPLTMQTVVYSFSTLLVTQVLTARYDSYCVKNEMAPLWFKKYRSTVFGLYITLTTVLFLIYYNNLPLLQRQNDPNRIKNLKTVMELEDLDFVKMVEEMKLQLNETDLRDMERKVRTKVTRVIDR